ncbi:MAG: integrase core domain-containing protein [Acidimicrobiia bacterium]
MVLAAVLADLWASSGVPTVAQFDNHSNFRGAIPPAYQHFGPVVATCLDLGVTPRLIPLREPWRNGVIEHFNDVWDKSFFRTETFTSLDHLQAESQAFIEFHNQQHRYSVHSGSTPNQMWDGRSPNLLKADYQPPTRLPARGQIEIVRYIRSNRLLSLFGKQITLAEDQTHQYVTAIIIIRAKRVIVITHTGEIIHDGAYDIARTLQ